MRAIALLCLVSLAALSCKSREFNDSSGAETNAWNGTGSCSLENADGVICSNGTIGVFGQDGTKIGDAKPGEFVCKSDKVTASGSRWSYFPTPPQGPAYVPDASTNICNATRRNYTAGELAMFSYGVVDLMLFLQPGEVRVTMAYATTYNFTGRNHYGDSKKCFLQPGVARKVAVAARNLLQRGWRLVMLDCGRPYEVQSSLYEAVGHDGNKAAPPGESKHNYGAAVDVTIEPVEGQPASDNDIINSRTRTLMGSTFDDFANGHLIPTNASVSREQRDRRKLLVEVMAAAGLKNYSGEWWHFDGDANYRNYPVIRNRR